MKHGTTLLAASLLFMGGCGVFKTKDAGKSLKKTDADLVGTWATDCMDRELDLSANMIIEEFEFSALGDFDRNTIMHTDEGCQDEAIHMTLSGTYSEEGAVEGKPELKNINLTVDKVTVTPDTDEAATNLNEKEYCGVTDWSKGKTVDVTGKDCPGFNLNQGNVIFDIYQVQDKNLQFGKTFLMLNKRFAETRPDELDSEIIYHKK